MNSLINFGPVVVAVLAEARTHFGNPGTWNSHEVGPWVQRRVRELVAGNAPMPEPMPTRSSRLDLVPLVPDDERAAIQAESLVSSEDGWR